MRTINDLPEELILYIFRYLGFSDYLAASSSSKCWRNLLLGQNFNQRILVNLHDVVLCDLEPPGSILFQSEQIFRNFLFEDVQFGNVKRLITKIGYNATNVSFDNCTLNDEQFCEIVCLMPNLRSLTIASYPSPFGSDLQYLYKKQYANNLSEMKNLRLYENCNLPDTMSDSQVLELLKVRNNRYLKDYKDRICKIVITADIRKDRDVLEDKEVDAMPSNFNLTLKYMKRALKQHVSIRELKLNGSGIYDRELETLAMQVDLKLRSFHLKNCDEVSLVSITRFLKTQPQLRVLNLSSTKCLNDEGVEIIVQTNPLLEVINLASCAELTNDGAVHLAELPHLRHLDINRCKSLTTDAIMKGIARNKNTVLRELIIRHLDISEECVKGIAHNLPELCILNLDYCVDAVTDDTLQCIIQHLPRLHDLSMEGCFRITDAALTGISVKRVYNRMVTATNSSSQLNELIPISKCYTLHAAQAHNLIEKEDFEGMSIHDLRNLRSLNLNYNHNITDVSLIYGIKFNEMRRLQLNCAPISLAGINTLARNCPSIEVLEVLEYAGLPSENWKEIKNKFIRLRK